PNQSTNNGASAIRGRLLSIVRIGLVTVMAKELNPIKNPETAPTITPSTKPARPSQSVMRTFVHNEPLLARSTKLTTTLDGAGKNNSDIKPVRLTSSQSPINRLKPRS